MKSIELTEEHKSKLLEMCKVLFPNYPNLEVRNSMEDFCMKQDDCFIELQESGVNSRNDTIIHWFEFCILWLATIIYNKRKTNNFSILEYRDFLCQSVEHPIDFLYEEFKKLK